MTARIYPFSKAGRDLDRDRAELSRQFEAVLRRTERRQQRRRYLRQWLILACLMVLATFAGRFVTEITPKPVWDHTRHMLAAPSCDAARAVGLAPALRGQPGYWPKHDADGDGIA